MFIDVPIHLFDSTDSLIYLSEDLILYVLDSLPRKKACFNPLFVRIVNCTKSLGSRRTEALSVTLEFEVK